jgi:hypothetical protein
MPKELPGNPVTEADDGILIVRADEVPRLRMDRARENQQIEPDAAQRCQTRNSIRPSR